MAKIDNPAKEFQFRVIIPGLNPFLAQEVTLPERSNDVVEHGDTNHLIKTPGMAKLGTLRIDKICPADSIDNPMWVWLESAQDMEAGGGILPSALKKSAMVEQLANDGVSVIKSWLLSGVWPQTINGVKFSRTSSANTVESIEFCVDRMKAL